MSLFRALIGLLIALPLLEIWILIRIGAEIGAPLTVGLVIFTAILGAWLVRRQGLRTLARVRARVDAGELPAQDLLEGLLLLFAGLCLLTPGFFTDLLGFLCLIPQLRAMLARALLVAMTNHGLRAPASGAVIVEGEFWESETGPRALDRDRRN
jgi:UPF0716 protein FxsA